MVPLMATDIPKKPIIGIGRPTVEFLGTMHRYPDKGEKAELRQFSIQGGGTVATALAALAGWGHPTELVAKVGDDPFGRLVGIGLQVHGVGLRGLVTQPDRLSPFQFIALQELRELQRSVFYTQGTVTPLQPAEVDLSLLEGSAALLIDGSEPEVQELAAQRARELRVPVFLDAGGLGEGMGELTGLCDVLVASERFAADVAPKEELVDSLLELRQLGPRLVVLTMGTDGAVGLYGDRMVRQAIFDEITPLERTGAGDAFFAGVVHGMLSEWSLEKILQFASAVAGLTCRQIGSRAGLPDLVEAGQVAWPDER